MMNLPLIFQLRFCHHESPSLTSSLSPSFLPPPPPPPLLTLPLFPLLLGSTYTAILNEDSSRQPEKRHKA